MTSEVDIGTHAVFDSFWKAWPSASPLVQGGSGVNDLTWTC